MIGAFAHSSGYAGGGIYTIAVVNIGTSSCRIGGYPQLLGIRDGHEYAIRHLDHGTQDVSLEPATLAPRMGGAFILDVSLGVPLFVPCGIGESQLGFAKGYDFN
jgi:hypothetical protein